MATKPSLSIADYPAEIVTAVAIDASRDANRVAIFLDALGLKGTPARPMSMPGSFLLHLGVALRLLMWEAQGFFFHRDTGLPEARQAIRDAFLSLHDPNANPTELCVAVLAFSVERFAWSGPRDLAADIAIDDLTDEAALDALAKYFWASRHAGGVAASPQP